ncbi:hypothetical protein WG66_009822 [Moniliophthora roreri]|nr:hypothetical protein WG66_009822 [Moniliophthora roreri]
MTTTEIRNPPIKIAAISSLEPVKSGISNPVTEACSSRWHRASATGMNLNEMMGHADLLCHVEFRGLEFHKASLICK